MQSTIQISEETLASFWKVIKLAESMGLKSEGGFTISDDGREFVLKIMAPIVVRGEPDGLHNR